MELVVEQALADFRRRFPGATNCVVGWAPGRINLIGDHTDYNGGKAMPMAIDLGIGVIFTPRDDGMVHVYSMTLDAEVEFAQDAALEDVPPWARYVLGVLRLAREQGCGVEGCDMVINANLPLSGGLSSSAALTTAICMALRQAYAWTLPDIATAQLCQRVEHDYLGLQCGLMDQLACLLTRTNTAAYIDCATLDTELVPFAPELGIVIVDSGYERALHDSGYNQRRSECDQAVAALRKAGIALEYLDEVDVQTIRDAEATMEALIYRRALHVVTENLRTEQAREALIAREAQKLGELMLASHDSLRDDYEVSVAQLDFIVESAMQTSAAYGARVTGAGFGGNAIVLARVEDLDGVAEQVTARFADRFGYQPNTFKVGTTQEARG